MGTSIWEMPTVSLGLWCQSHFLCMCPFFCASNALLLSSTLALISWWITFGPCPFFCLSPIWSVWNLQSPAQCVGCCQNLGILNWIDSNSPYWFQHALIEFAWVSVSICVCWACAFLCGCTHSLHHVHKAPGGALHWFCMIITRASIPSEPYTTSLHW